jgi:regulator of cell morphogenesis and NO signaling
MRLRQRKDTAGRKRDPRSMKPITENTTVAEVASTLPSSVRVFQRHGIDFCCGGKIALGLACREQGISFPELARAIEAAATEPAPDHRDWGREPLHALVDHIVTTYHEPLREELPRLESMARKVSGVHGAKAPHLARVEAIVAELSSDLQSHMRKEEMVLFPAIRTVEQGHGRPSIPIAVPITVMEHEHDHAGNLLAELRTITEGYAAPSWACESFRALYRGLSELESAMHVHVHLENNVLFPRALRLAGGEPSRRLVQPR